MNNEGLIASSINELVYAESILTMIIDNNASDNQNLANTIESVVENIARAKKSTASIRINSKYKTVGDIEISTEQTIETVIGSILKTLETAITLKVAEESGHLKNQDEHVINLINSAMLNLNLVYEKVSFSEY